MLIASSSVSSCQKDVVVARRYTDVNSPGNITTLLLYNKLSCIIYYNIAFVNSEGRLAKSRVDITLCQHGKFPATFLLKFFVLYYKRNIKHFFRIDIQLYQHS